MPAPPKTINALPATVNLLLYAGDDFYLTLTVSLLDGNPADLSGATAQAQVRPAPGDPSIVSFTATIAGNLVTLHMSAANSVTLPTNGVWDAQIIDASGRITTLAAGNVNVRAQVTP
jgi:hypothetical protein